MSSVEQQEIQAILDAKTAVDDALAAGEASADAKVVAMAIREAGLRIERQLGKR